VARLRGKDEATVDEKEGGGDGVKKGRYEPCRSSKGCLKLPSKMRKKMWAPWEAKEAAVEHKPGQCRRRTCGPSAQERHGHPEGEALAAKRADQADQKRGGILAGEVACWCVELGAPLTGKREAWHQIISVRRTLTLVADMVPCRQFT
jgi:hypothetical protein